MSDELDCCLTNKEKIISIMDKSPNHAYELLMEYQERIDKKDKEIASLKEQLKREQDCVDFYTSTGETVHAEGYILYGYNIEKDLEWGDDRYPKMGKLARATQARREK